jgi:hypothetical protein
MPHTPPPDDPLSALKIGERPEPEVPAGWVRVRISHASLNRHDLFTARGERAFRGDRLSDHSGQRRTVMVGCIRFDIFLPPRAQTTVCQSSRRWCGWDTPTQKWCDIITIYMTKNLGGTWIGLIPWVTMIIGMRMTRNQPDSPRAVGEQPD